WRAVARAVWRQDLVGVVLREGAPDPARSPRGLRAGGSADRGRGLGGLAADRDRDALELHCGLQGDLVEARRLPGRRLLRRARSALRARRRREDVASDLVAWRAGRWPERPRGCLDGP